MRMRSLLSEALSHMWLRVLSQMSSLLLLRSTASTLLIRVLSAWKSLRHLCRSLMILLMSSYLTASRIWQRTSWRSFIYHWTLPWPSRISFISRIILRMRKSVILQWQKSACSIHTGQITAVIQHSLQSLRMSSLTMASTAHRLKIPTRIISIHFQISTRTEMTNLSAWWILHFLPWRD